MFVPANYKPHGRFSSFWSFWGTDCRTKTSHLTLQRLDRVIMGHLTALTGVVALVSMLIPEAAAQSCSGVTGRYQPKMGSGYRSSVLATGLRQPRHIVVDSAGNLLVAEGGSQGVRRLVLQDNGNIVCVQSNTQIVSGSVRQICVPIQVPAGQLLNWESRRTTESPSAPTARRSLPPTSLASQHTPTMPILARSALASRS